MWPNNRRHQLFVCFFSWVEGGGSTYLVAQLTPLSPMYNAKLPMTPVRHNILVSFYREWENVNFKCVYFYMINNSLIDKCKLLWMFFKPFDLPRRHLSHLSPCTWCNARWVIGGAVMTPGYEGGFETWLTPKRTGSWSAWVNEILYTMLIILTLKLSTKNM